MAKEGKGYLPLTVKVDLILVSALALGVGLVMTASTLSLLSSRDTLTRRELLRQGDLLYASVANFMLAGEAPLAVKFFSDVGLATPDSKIALFRRNGIPAFSDNATIDRVNANLKKEKFSRRPARAAVGAAAVGAAVAIPAASAPPRIAEAAGLSESGGEIPRELFFRDDADGKAYFRALRPMINLPKCSVCHGADHTVRGVVDIRSEVTTIIRAQERTVAAGGGGFVLVVAALALAIGGFLRRVVIAPVRAIAGLCAEVAAGRFDGRVAVRGRDEIGELGRTVNEMAEGLFERFELTKYVSAETIGALKAGQAPRRVGRTLLFSDVRGFTSYTETHSPERVVEMLNALLDGQAEMILRHGGDIDKFVGDEIVAVFSGERASRRACLAARDLVAFCAAKAADFDGLSVGVGIASGQVIHGMIGSQRRADYTVIGDPVNVASRLCAIAKAYQILVSDEARAEVGAGLDFLGPYAAKLKGKADAQKVWMLSTAAGAAGL